MTYDVAVAGLGGMGGAVAARSTLAGARCIGIEQYARGHGHGASTGRTRIIRQAYFEDPAYVPLLLRAYELWRDLERRALRPVLDLCGLLLTGPDDGEVIAGSRAAARRYDLDVEHLEGAELRRRFPTLLTRDGEVGLYEREGGVVFPEAALEAHLDVAVSAGAELRFDTALERWEAHGDGVRLSLSDGSIVDARALVLTLGPWFAAEFARLGIDLKIERNVQVWFSPRTHAYDAGRFPAFLVERAGAPPLYGFPDFGDGVKAAFHGSGVLTTPAALERGVVVERDVAPLAAALDAWMPGAAGTVRETKACMYALTPDRNFVVGLHPEHRNVVLCGGFSGHGYKFASVVGEIGADLALTGTTAQDIAFLSVERFAHTPAAREGER